MKISADPLRPFSKLGCSNHEALSHGTEGRSPRDDPLMFWDEFRHTENAKSCVVGKSPMGALASGVESIFGQTRPNSPAWKEHLL